MKLRVILEIFAEDFHEIRIPFIMHGVQYRVSLVDFTFRYFGLTKKKEEKIKKKKKKFVERRRVTTLGLR